MKVFKGAGDFFCLEVPFAKKDDVANLMAYRGLTFSTSASARDKAVLFTPNPYALADLAEIPELAPYRREIDLSRALDGVGTRAAARPRAVGLPKGHARLSPGARRRDRRRSAGARKNPHGNCVLQPG
jgi:hypothetical protein